MKSITHNIHDSELNDYFSKKVDKNDWCYTGKRSRGDAIKIEHLYQRVIREDEVCNNQLFGTLARAMFADF